MDLVFKNIIFFLRKIVTLLENFLVNKNQELEAGIEIDPSSLCKLNNIRFKKRCFLNIEAQTQVIGTLIFERENASISIGKRVFISGSIIAAQRVDIGDDVLVSWGTTIVDHNSHSTSFTLRSNDAVDWLEGKKDWTHVKIAPVKISNKVWIGFNCIILKGVTIGEGAVVGAGSVVTKDVPQWTIVAGNPARVIREIPENER
jgi:acetyltransferase-like isoleucine patch superfamily enzyme